MTDAAARLEEDDRELARLRDLLAQQAAAAEDAAGAMSADVAAAKAAREASRRDLEDAEARRLAADRALAELKETHRTFVADAGDQLDHLTSQVAVLKARLSAQDAREAMIADQEAQIEDLRRRLETACAGVEGPVASALRRARATLRNATSETGPGFAAEHDESFRALHPATKARTETKARTAAWTWIKPPRRGSKPRRCSRRRRRSSPPTSSAPPTCSRRDCASRASGRTI